MYPRALKLSIIQPLELDNSEEDAIGSDYCQQREQSSKHRNYVTCILKVSPETLYGRMGVSFKIKNCTDQNRDLYKIFPQQRIIDGIIQWLKCSEQQSHNE